MPIQLACFLFSCLAITAYFLGIRIGRGGAEARCERRIIAFRRALIEINAKTHDTQWTSGMLKIRMYLIGELCSKTLKEDETQRGK